MSSRPLPSQSESIQMAIRYKVLVTNCAKRTLKVYSLRRDGHANKKKEEKLQPVEIWYVRIYYEEYA